MHGKERGEIIFEKYNEFLKELNNTSVPPVKVFYPLNKDLMEKLTLVREASKTLQKKKEDDIRAAQEAANKVEAAKKPDEEEPEQEETTA